MTIFTVGFTLLAALLHVYIFVLESFRWELPSTRRTFGVSEADAQVLAPMAFNQGFYNLFLALIALVGVAFYRTEHLTGTALALAGTASMLGAAIVLVAHDRRMMRAALVQGTLPLLAIVFLLLEY